MARGTHVLNRLTGVLALGAVIASMADMRRSREPPAGASKSYKRENIQQI